MELLSIVIGYLIGCINPAYIFGKMKGIDIREYGSKNAGASNAKLVLGKRYFVASATFDIIKPIIVYLLVMFAFPLDQPINSFPTLEFRAYLSAFACLIGHCHPFYIGFRGGKGFATYLGICLIADYRITLLILIPLLMLSLIKKYIIVATVGMCIIMPIAIFILRGLQLETCLLIVSALVVLWRHRVNFKRYFRGEELDMNGNYINHKNN